MIELPFGLFFLTLLLLASNAFLVACELSLVKLRYSLVTNGLSTQLLNHNRVAFLVKNSGWTGAAIRFAILLATLALGFTLISLIARFFASFALNLEYWGTASLTFTAFAITVFLVSLVGYQMPRHLAMAYPSNTLRFTSWFVTPVAVLIMPLYKVLVAITERLIQCFGIQAKGELNLLDFEVQIRALSNLDAKISPKIQKILQNALRLQELETSDVMLPRLEVQYLNLQNPLEQNLQLAKKARHTRFPLCDGDLDNCIGLVHIKDLFHQSDNSEMLNLKQIKRNIISFSSDKPLESALWMLLSENIHMALVKDEFGGIEGVLTLEGILERLVGEIQDEFDVPTKAKVSVSPKGFNVDGLTPLHELEEIINFNMPNTEASTVGGLITEKLGRLSIPGETVPFQELGFVVTVNEVSKKRILSATVVPLDDNSEEE